MGDGRPRTARTPDGTDRSDGDRRRGPARPRVAQGPGQLLGPLSDPASPRERPRYPPGVAPRPDRRYFDEQIAPLLGDGIEFVGHLDHRTLARLVGSASVAVVSPCWDEPYGLVVAEALACGTPIAGFARGALPELLDDTCGVLAAPGDVAGLAAAITRAARLDRTAARRHAERTCSIEAMVDGYELLYEELVA